MTLEDLKTQAADLGVPPETLLASKLLEVYNTILDHARWLHNYPEAPEKVKSYMFDRLTRRLDNVDDIVLQLKTLTRERSECLTTL